VTSRIAAREISALREARPLDGARALRIGGAEIADELFPLKASPEGEEFAPPRAWMLSYGASDLQFSRAFCLPVIACSCPLFDASNRSRGLGRGA